MTSPHHVLPPILPGATLGVLGGGQLGKMFCSAAQRMGYRVWVLDPDSQCPASVIADRHLCADFEDTAALTLLSAECVAITTEFENIPAPSLALLAQHNIVSPSDTAVSIIQHRWLEKTFLREHQLPTAPFWKLEGIEDIKNIPLSAFPGLLKISRLGYDGKGQVSVTSINNLESAWAQLNHAPCILEQRLNLDMEISVMVARSYDATATTWPVAENQHRNGILELSIVPARITTTLAAEARQLALQIADALNYVGILGVEFFVVDGKLYINELAPRPHNSGHYTIEASETSQFEQQVRTLCRLPLGQTDMLCPAVMLNLLGDLWLPQSPDWHKILAYPGIKLHLYGKHIPRAQRKMGHLTCLAPQLDDAIQCIQQVQKCLNERPLS